MSCLMVNAQSKQTLPGWALLSRRARNGDLVTNGNEAERDPGMHAVAQATEEMAAMAAQYRAEEAVLRDAQVVLDNAEWNYLTPQEQEAQIAADEAEEEAHLDQRRAELEEDIERYASDPEPEIG